MGITGLLLFLAPVTRDIHVKDYAGKRVAIDGYSWLHKAAYSCSQELCLGKPTNRARANAFLMEGNAEEARKCFQKAVDITPLIAFGLIKELRRRGVEYIVAPYEADAQMAYLAITGQVDAIITEDSDLITYGTPNTLLKMDPNGYCKEIKREDLGSCKGKGYDLADFNLTMLRHIDIDKIMTVLKREKGASAEYQEMFRRADLTFKHQRVYDPCTKTLVHFTALSEDLVDTNLDYLGEYMDDETAERVATAIVDPVNKQPFDNADQQMPAFTFKTQPRRYADDEYIEDIKPDFLSFEDTTPPSQGKKSFRKTSLVSNERISLSIFDQFIYGKKKESVLMASTSVATAAPSRSISNLSKSANSQPSPRLEFVSSPPNTIKRKESFNISPTLKKSKLIVNSGSLEEYNHYEGDTQEEGSADPPFITKKSSSFPDTGSSNRFDPDTTPERFGNTSDQILSKYFLNQSPLSKTPTRSPGGLAINMEWRSRLSQKYKESLQKADE
eukprot:gene6716-7809_t